MAEIGTCAECGQEFPKDEMYYGDAGELLCRQCESDRDVKSGFRNSYIGMATGALAMSLVSICINFFMIPSILAVVGAIHALRFPDRLKPDEREAIDDLSWVPAVAIIALVIGIGKTLLSALTIFGILTL